VTELATTTKSWVCEGRSPDATGQCPCGHAPLRHVRAGSSGPITCDVCTAERLRTKSVVGLFAIRRTSPGCEHCGPCAPKCPKTRRDWLTLTGYKWSADPADRLVFALREQAVYWIRRMRRYYCPERLRLVRLRPPKEERR
jgi:hypothetical protein